jgi:hypothetical protein
MNRRSSRSRWSAVGALVIIVALVSGLADQDGAAYSDLFTRVGLTAEEAARARSGQPAVRILPSSVDSEVAVAGAIRIRGDLERLVLWLRDIEQFRRSLGSDAVGAIENPARPADFAGISAADLDLAELEGCRPGRCGIRMPAAYVARFSKEVAWGGADAPPQAARLVRQLLAEYTATYQSGGDPALGSYDNQREPQAVAAAFRDMVRRAVPLWQLAYEFAAYLEEFPAQRPAGVEDRFYWTREALVKKPVATLHHVVLHRLGDGSLRFADKQFYASRDIDAALVIGQATPVLDGKAFDLAVSLRARVPMAGSLAGRLLRDRVEREVAGTFTAYLDWLQQSFAR